MVIFFMMNCDNEIEDKLKFYFVFFLSCCEQIEVYKLQKKKKTFK